MQKNLVLVANPSAMDGRDFIEIGKAIVKDWRHITVAVVTTDQTPDVLPKAFWQRPTLTVAFGPLGKFKALRGLVLKNAPVHKLQQYIQFSLAGIETPRTAVYVPGQRHDAAEWGDFCIVKPCDLGKTSKGGTVQWLRTARLSAFDPARYPEEHVFRRSRLLVQRFVDTGPFPTNWRVLTLFGEPLYCLKSFCPIERPSLDAADELIEAAVVETKHPTVKERFVYKDTRAFEADPEIMAFARQIYQAFPRLPLQGCDILREAGTGRLYAIEINGGGNTWHFSSTIFAKQRDQLGGKEVLLQQFDAFAVAARVLARKAEQLAV